MAWGSKNKTGRHLDAEDKAKLVARIKARWKNPAYRAKMIGKIKARWKNPAYRAKMKAAIQKRWANPEYKAKMHAKTEARWNAPGYRDAQKAKRLARFNSLTADQKLAQHNRRSTAIRAAAAKRKALGIKVHRKPMTADAKAAHLLKLRANLAKLTPEQKLARHNKLSTALKAAAAKRKALGIKSKPMSAATRAAAQAKAAITRAAHAKPVKPTKVKAVRKGRARGHRTHK